MNSKKGDEKEGIISSIIFRKWFFCAIFSSISIIFLYFKLKLSVNLHDLTIWNQLYNYGRAVLFPCIFFGFSLYPRESREQVYEERQFGERKRRKDRTSRFCTAFLDVLESVFEYPFWKVNPFVGLGRLSYACIRLIFAYAGRMVRCGTKLSCMIGHSFVYHFITFYWGQMYFSALVTQSRSNTPTPPVQHKGPTRRRPSLRHGNKYGKLMKIGKKQSVLTTVKTHPKKRKMEEKVVRFVTLIILFTIAEALFDSLVMNPPKKITDSDFWYTVFFSGNWRGSVTKMFTIFSEISDQRIVAIFLISVSSIGLLSVCSRVIQRIAWIVLLGIVRGLFGYFIFLSFQRWLCFFLFIKVYFDMELMIHNLTERHKMFRGEFFNVRENETSVPEKMIDETREEIEDFNKNRKWAILFIMAEILFSSVVDFFFAYFNPKGFLWYRSIGRHAIAVSLLVLAAWKLVDYNSSLGVFKKTVKELGEEVNTFSPSIRNDMKNHVNKWKCKGFQLGTLELPLIPFSVDYDLLRKGSLVLVGSIIVSPLMSLALNFLSKNLL